MLGITPRLRWILREPKNVMKGSTGAAIEVKWQFERAKHLIEAGVFIQILLIIALMIAGPATFPIEPGRRLPDLSSLEILAHDEGLGIHSADENGVILLLPSCQACRQLTVNISNAYPRMIMSVTGILFGKREDAIGFMSIVKPRFAIHYAGPESEWARMQPKYFPYIIITDSHGIPLRVDASWQDLY